MLLELTFRELMYIDDVVTVTKVEHSFSKKTMVEDRGTESLRGTSGGAVIVVPIEFVLRIGSAILKIVEETSPNEIESHVAEVYVDESDLWLLREIAQSDLLVGKERVGLNLKMKVHSALRTAAAEREMEELGLKQTKDGKEIEDWSDKLSQWEAQNANTNKNPNQDNSEDSTQP
ncbi:MAG: hypothetical protein ABIH92_03305 [Nanoarchaeota archaeon]